MDVKAIRLRNLRELVREFGTIAALAEKCRTNANHLSRLMSPKADRSIGHDLARKLERGAGREPGWLDHDHRAGVREPSVQYGLSLSPEARQIAERWDEMPEGLRAYLIDQMNIYFALLDENPRIAKTLFAPHRGKCQAQHERKIETYQARSKKSGARKNG